ncbi:MAG: hypothetical protein PHT30_05325, partial [Bacilli bacterium]|nr:hypothetical protein [Bacilli bacterium]
MKTKQFLILSLILVSFLLASCRPNQSSNTDSISGSDISEISSDTSNDTSTSSNLDSSSDTSSEPTTNNPNPQNSKAIVTTVQALAQKKATDTKTFIASRALLNMRDIIKKDILIWLITDGRLSPTASVAKIPALSYPEPHILIIK